jgi:LysM repeat protein
MVRSWNRLKGSSLAGRKVLYLHLPVTPAATPRAGETRLAARHSSRSKHPAGTQTASAKSAGVSPGPAVKRHTVKRGETLYSIASSYNTTVTALKHDNRNIAALRPGMILIVHEPH